jgi:hypothetical protein
VKAVCDDESISSPNDRCASLIIISVLALGGVPEKWLLLSSLEESTLVKKNKSLLSGRQSVLWRLCGSFPWGQFPPSLVVKMLSGSPVLPGFQSDYKVTAERTAERKEHRCKNGGRDAKIFSCF